jgi:pimeloyl-[acyl-carrier protein] methyl ester esterase
MKLLLLPGLDGTGELFADFVKSLSETYSAAVLKYPTDRFLNYTELKSLVELATQSSDPFVLVAESFSTPLAIKFAATRPSNLKGVVLCAGFATSPLKGLSRLFSILVMPFLFRMKLPGFAVKYFLIGPTSQQSLMTSVLAAVSSVEPKVLSGRLREVLSCDARIELSEIAVPILYLQADLDRLVPARCLEDVRQIIPQVEVARIAGPHLLLQCEPHLAAEVVARFTDRVSERFCQPPRHSGGL